jgi:uncharacterized membrane protein YuzA (DUF378 family)
MEKKKTLMKWVVFVSFAVLVFGGLNYLLMGLFKFDLFAEMFGGMDAVASRVFYAIFGLAAVTLAAVIICKAFYGKHTKAATTARATASAT